MKRLCIFAHYDAQSEVKPYVLHYLRALRPACERIVFVSTAALPDEAVDRARAVCDEVVLRPNRGFDFGMWSHVILATDLAPWDELLLTNSSIFGPLTRLDALLGRMSADRCDFWGMTDNDELHWHIQSYFVVFKKKVLESPAFADFWRSVLPYRNKLQVIFSYELGLTTFLTEADFVPKVLVPMESLPRAKDHDGIYGNTTCLHPLEVLRAGLPFVKVELLRDNPYALDLRPIVAEMNRAGYDPALVAFDRPQTDAARLGALGPLERVRHKLRSRTR
jgi:lipopolysaccharide biosynthesis protein